MPTLAASINLVGIPPLSLEEFRQFHPGSVVNLFLAATLPLGEYDSRNLVNLGSNRWTFRVALPMMHPFEWIPGKLMTLELVPNLHFFTENPYQGRSAERNAEIVESLGIAQLQFFTQVGCWLPLWRDRCTERLRFGWNLIPPEADQPVLESGWQRLGDILFP